jgi:hypothetical protein
MTSTLRRRPKINFPTAGMVEAITILPTQIRIVDGRGVHTVALKDAVEEGAASVVWQRSGKNDIELFKGSQDEAGLMFDDFADRMNGLLEHNSAPPATAPKRSYFWGAVTVGAILTVGCVNGAVFYAMRDRAPPVDDARLATLENLTKQLQGLGMPDAPPSAQPGPPARTVKTVTVPTGLTAGAAAPGEAPAARAGAVVIPKELPPLPVQPAATDGLKVTAPVTDATPAKAPPANMAVTVNGPSSEIAVASDPIAPAGGPKEATKTADKPAEKAADKPAEATEANKDDAAKKDPLRDMSASEAQELLRQLEEIKTKTADGSELPIELLRKLPAEVAARLVGTGIATVSPQDRKERAQRQARIVRLPPSIINQYRDRTGIASIPESDSWVANGGRVSIPLPGGGDITSPDVMNQFGLKP